MFYVVVKNDTSWRPQSHKDRNHKSDQMVETLEQRRWRGHSWMVSIFKIQEANGFLVSPRGQIHTSCCFYPLLFHLSATMIASESVSAIKIRRVTALRDLKWLPNVKLQNIWGNYHLCGITERFRQSRLILVRRIDQKEGFNQQLLSFIVINSKIRSW